jgi:FkbM family methyltransferase
MSGWRSLVQERISRHPSHDVSVSQPSYADVVGALYAGLLGRQGAEAEVAAWVASLEAGTSLDEVVREFDVSLEREDIEAHHPRVRPSAGLAEPPLVIVDVGAAPLLNEDDIFRPLLDGGNCRVLGFEPFAETHQLRDEPWAMLPHLVGDGSPRTFYETSFGPSSSLYEPDLDVMSDFVGLAESCTVVSTREVATVTLDSVVEDQVDFLKMDVQGAELDVLRGAERVLSDVLVIHAEVEFVPIYRNQPLFDDVFRFLRQRGFDLFDLTYLRRTRYQGREGGRRERLLWGEAVFIPTRGRLDGLDPERRAKIIRIMRDVFGAGDFGNWLQDRTTSP